MAFGARQSFGRYIAVQSHLHLLDPLVKILVFALVMISIFSAASWLAIAAVTGYVILLGRASRVRLGFYLESLKYFAWMFALSFAINVIFPRDSTVGAFSPQALALAGIFASRLALMIFVAAIFTVVTCPSEIGEGLMVLSRVRGRVGRRAAEAAAVLSMALRFVPVMFEEAERIRAAQILRGARPRGLTGRVRSVVEVIVPLMESSLRRAGNLGFALEARCYGYRVPASRGVSLGRDEVAFLASVIGLLLVVIRLR